LFQIFITWMCSLPAAGLPGPGFFVMRPFIEESSSVESVLLASLVLPDFVPRVFRHQAGSSLCPMSGRGTGEGHFWALSNGSIVKIADIFPDVDTVSPFCQKFVWLFKILTIPRLLWDILYIISLS
jgi:hypothetical protein